MNQLKILRIAASIIVYFLLQAHGADKYTDENRPYEFGFKVDGQQHRHESKDKDGIIMGEFGFITADDVYHVTVYATDKEGRFKILSMKNIKLKQSSAQNSAPPTSARQGHSLALPAPEVATAQVAPAQVIVQGAPATQPKKPISIEPPGKSCSSCSIPTTTTRAPPPAFIQAPNSSPNVFPAQRNNFGLGGQSQGELPNYPASQKIYPQQNYPQEENRRQADVPTYAQQSEQNYPSSPNAQSPSAPNYPSNAQSPSVSNYPSNAQIPSVPKYSSNSQPGPSAIGQKQQANLQPPAAPQTYPEQHNLPSGNNGPQPGGPVGSAPPVDNFGQLSPQQSGPNVPIPSQNPYAQGGAPGRTSKQYNGPDQPLDSYTRPASQQGSGQIQPGSGKPTLVSAQMQIVDKNTNIHALGPGEQAGLPPGLTEDDVSQLLYTFNYTVGFHGHFEEGYRNGVKKGYYFVTGRNGVKTRIDYVADDTGFHPKVSQEVLDLLSDDVPKPETEKDAKFGLKGYEFKWLYYPTDSKKR